MVCPNLFAWATSELSQDALICWWLDWAKPENSSINAAMHSSGRVFLDSLLKKHKDVFKDGSLPELKSLEVHRQYYNIDILVIVNGEYALLIEDKTHTSAHGDQLDNYKKTIAEKYQACRVLPTYVKTGSQSRYQKEEDAGYKLFLRDDFLRILRDLIEENHLKNDILIDFYENLKSYDADIKSFENTSVNQWGWNAWVGFYEYLQTQIDDLTWDYVPNPAGGFLGAWWGFKEWQGCTVYLQIEQGPLCLKIAVEETDKQSEIRNCWHNSLMATATSLELTTIKKPPRFGKGTWMTAAIIERSDWLVEVNGCIDLDNIMKNLRKAKELIEKTVQKNMHP